MFNAKLFLAGFVCFGGVAVRGIVSRGSSNALSEKNCVNSKSDNSEAESISRDYNVAGYDDAYGHEGYGLTAHASYGLPEEHGYGVHAGHNVHVHHVDNYHHKHYDYNYHKALALKGLLVPLAGVALLGAAAAFVSNPILLQLGVISGSSLGRKKRDTVDKLTRINEGISDDDRIRQNELKLLEKFLAEVPREDIRLQNKRIFADYLSCSGITSKNACLERVACELHSLEGTPLPMEMNVLSVVVNEILQNDFVPESVKMALSQAIKRGKQSLGCDSYTCDAIDKTYGFKTL